MLNATAGHDEKPSRVLAKLGCTLKELLVVIAILAAILFPVFVRACEQARKATCQSNISRMAAAWLMLLLLSCVSSAHAGFYTVSYSGGNFSTTGSEGTSSYPYTLGTDGFYGAGGGGGWGTWNDNGTPTAYSGGAKCEGEITVTFTWQPSGSNDSSPSVVVIAETGNTSFSGASNTNAAPTTATCSNDLGFPPGSASPPPPGVPYFTISGTSSGTRYQIKTEPGDSFTLTCSPRAAFEGAGTVGPPAGGGGGGVTVSYRATASPLQIVLNDGIDTPDGKRFLIGQRVSASLATGGLSANGFNWNVSGGEPFKNWTANSSSTTFAALGSETGSQLTFYFRKPSFNNEPATISCSFHLAVPSGAQPASGFDVTLNRQCFADKPFNSLAVFSGTTQGVPDSVNPQAMRFYGATYSPFGRYYVAGILWIGTVTTPAQYGSGGGWNYTQLVTTYRARRNSGVWQEMSYNGLPALDTSFGYYPVYPDLYSADGTEQVEGDSPAEGFGTNLSYLKVLDSFTTYTLYRPPGEGSCLVPLKNLNWFWQGEAQPDASGVWQIYNTGGAWSFVDDFPTHPMWERNISGTQWQPPVP